MSTWEETKILAYSADRSISSISQNGMSRYFNRDEAWQHAVLYIGMRTTRVEGKHFEITDVYVEGDEQAGVIMAVWQEAEA